MSDARTEADNRQVGGDHYKSGGEEHWTRVHRLGLSYFQGQITKYVERCWLKNGVEDLEKARHFLDKYIELSRATNRQGTLEALRQAERDQAEQQRQHLGELLSQALDALAAKTAAELLAGAEPASHGYVNQDGPEGVPPDAKRG